MIPRENDNDERGREELFETEKNRMDYEGGNQGEDCSDKGENVPQKDNNTRTMNPTRERSEEPGNTRP